MLSKQLAETWLLDGKFSGCASRREHAVGIVSHDVKTLRRRGETVNQAKVRKSNKADHLSLACEVSAHIAAIPLCHGVKLKPGNAVSAALGAKGRKPLCGIGPLRGEPLIATGGVNCAAINSAKVRKETTSPETAFAMPVLR